MEYASGREQAFYVWFDAPLGYLSLAWQCLVQQAQEDLPIVQWWREKRCPKLVHFIGKDIGYFHCLFWPALLAASRQSLPQAVYTHGHVTFAGRKLSKSQGPALLAAELAQKVHPDFLRYYLLSRFNDAIDDDEFFKSKILCRKLTAIW